MNNWKEKIPAIFAEQGDILEVPLDAQTDSQVSFETGYTANYERDAVDDLGNPLVQYGIERTKFNYLMKVITSALKEIQETIPTYEDNGVDKVDVSSIVTDTNAFDVLESILCINADTGKASKITKDDIIKNLNPDVDLSNSNISVSQLATTAVDNFLALDGDIVKKADKLLQEAIAEINLSADNVVVSASATVDVVDSVIVMNTDGKVAKATTIPQENIEEINLSKDNIAIDEYTDQEQGSVFKPVISSNTGSVYRKDKLEGSMIESIKFEQIEDDVYARSINYTIMTSDTYPDGIDNLIQTGVYHVITLDEYKDIINDQIDTADKEEYILKVMNSFLTNLNMIKEPFTDIASLVAYAGSDFISPYEPIIQVLGVSANETDDTNVTQVFKLNGEVEGQRTFTATTDGLTNEVWIPVSTYIRNTIEEELIAFMYDGVPDEATGDVGILRTFKTIGYNNKEELSYGFSFGGFNCYDVITIDTDLDWTDESDTVDNDVYVAAYTYNQSLLTIDDTKIIKLNGKVIENESDITNVKDVIFFVKDRTHNIKYIALGRNLGSITFVGYLFDESNDKFLDTTKTKDFFRLGFHTLVDAVSCTDYYNFNNPEIKLRNIVIGADIKMFTQSSGVNTDTVIAKNLIVKDSSFNPVMTVTSASTTLSNELVIKGGSVKLIPSDDKNIVDYIKEVTDTITGFNGDPIELSPETLSTLDNIKTIITTDGAVKKGIEINDVVYTDFIYIEDTPNNETLEEYKTLLIPDGYNPDDPDSPSKYDNTVKVLYYPFHLRPSLADIVIVNGKNAVGDDDIISSTLKNSNTIILYRTKNIDSSVSFNFRVFLIPNHIGLKEQNSTTRYMKGYTHFVNIFGITNVFHMLKSQYLYKNLSIAVQVSSPTALILTWLANDWDNTPSGAGDIRMMSDLILDKLAASTSITVTDNITNTSTTKVSDAILHADNTNFVVNTNNIKLKGAISANIESNTTIDGDLTVTGNLQADGLSLPDDVTLSKLSVTGDTTLSTLTTTGKAALASLAVTGNSACSSLSIRNLNKTDYANIFHIDGLLSFRKDKYSQLFQLLTNTDEEGENRNPCSLNFEAERITGESKKNIAQLYAFSPSPASRSSTIQLLSTSDSTNENDKITYSSYAHRFTGTIYENGHRLAPMPVSSSGAGQIYALHNNNLTLPEGGTWFVFRVICTSAKTIADTYLEIRSGGANLEQGDYLVFGFAWRII